MSLAVQGSPEWHKARAGKIKASVCAALEGKHKYMKSKDLVRQEVRALAGSESEFKMVPAVAHGQVMEDTARIFLEKTQGYTVEETGLVVHPKYDFLAASPDGLVGLDGCVEIKCPYPQYTKQPYSVFDPAKSVYLWQVYMQMEVLDADWCDFICYLANNETSEPQFTIERVERKQDFLTELVSRKYMPQPEKGTISRLDLYQAWHRWIAEQHRDPETRKLHTAPIETECAEVVTNDEDLNSLTKIQNRIHEIKDRISDELEILDILSTSSMDLKKSIAGRFDSSVSNGKTTVKITSKTPPIDYRKAFEFLGGEDEVLNKDESIDSFRRTTGTKQVTILHGDQL
jgi:putative phage-type endonuclease